MENGILLLNNDEIRILNITQEEGTSSNTVSTLRVTPLVRKRRRLEKWNYLTILC